MFPHRFTKLQLNSLVLKTKGTKIELYVGGPNYTIKKNTIKRLY
jgi:hypothetical protein